MVTTPNPVMTRAQMRASLDLLPTWTLEQKAAAFCTSIALVKPAAACTTTLRGCSMACSSAAGQRAQWRDAHSRLRAAPHSTVVLAVEPEGMLWVQRAGRPDRVDEGVVQVLLHILGELDGVAAPRRVPVVDAHADGWEGDAVFTSWREHFKDADPQRPQEYLESPGVVSDRLNRSEAPPSTGSAPDATDERSAK